MDSQNFSKKVSTCDRNAFIGPVIPSLGTLRLHELEVTRTGHDGVGEL